MDTYKYPKEVEWEIDQNNKSEHLKLANNINSDINVSGVIIQHEYGIFGGDFGENILAFMQTCSKPILVTLHTVLPHPTAKMKKITTQIIKLARIIIVLTDNSKKIVEKIYPEAKEKVSVIPHGIHPTEFAEPEEYKIKLELENHIILSTFGLLNRGKGIEYVIKSLPNIVKKYPSILYLVLGETHPVIRRKEGEKYRIELIKLVSKLGLQKHVKFYDQYLALSDLFTFLKATDIYISSSTNPHQAVSGTLSYALGAGRAVISTQFAQAKEIVTPDIGSLVPIKNSTALTAAILHLLSDKKRLKQMHLNAYKKTRYMLWSNVAKEYISLLEQTMLPTINNNHLEKMTDNFGLFQFASYALPNKKFGYTLDDNARALILCSWLIKQNYTKKLNDLTNIYFSFVKKCLQKDGSFINYISSNNQSPTNQNNNEDLEETHGRTLWALSEIMDNNSLTTQTRNEAKKIFLIALKKGSKLTHLRAKAYAIKSFALASKIFPAHRTKLLDYIKTYADSLVSALKHCSRAPWFWFENHLSYNNGLLPESLLIAGKITKYDSYTEKGFLSLKFLIKKTFSSNMYHPIGNKYWHTKNQQRSQYDQQPEDPASMIFALNQAFETTKDEKYKILAKKCFSWFLGKNTLNNSLYDKKSGGCYDGLHPDRVNLNQGAESLVSFLMSNYVINKFNK